MKLILLAWILCTILSYGLGFAYLQRKYPNIANNNYWCDMLFAATMALAGPINLFVIGIFGYYKHGVKFK